MISIIIPVLNEAEGIEFLLQKLQVHRNVGHEIIVVDGGSQDQTISRSRTYADHVIQTEKGRGLQMNKGAAIARGEILLFLHADTQLPSIELCLLSQELNASKKNWGRFDVKLSENRIIFKMIASLMNLRSRFSSIATGDQAIFVRKKFFMRLNGFADIVLMEDIEFCKRAKRLSKPLCLKVKVTTSSRRWQQTGVWRTIILMWQLRFAYYFGVQPETLKQYYRTHVR